MRKWVSIVLLVCFIMPVYGYDKLDIVEADRYIDSVEYSVIRDIVIEYDYLEHTAPVITYPITNYILMEDDLLIDYESSMIVEHGRLKYAFPLEQEVVYNFTTIPDDTWKFFVTFVLGAVGGMAVGYVIGIL